MKSIFNTTLNQYNENDDYPIEEQTPKGFSTNVI